MKKNPALSPGPLSLLLRLAPTHPLARDVTLDDDTVSLNLNGHAVSLTVHDAGLDLTYALAPRPRVPSRRWSGRFVMLRADPARVQDVWEWLVARLTGARAQCLISPHSVPDWTLAVPWTQTVSAAPAPAPVRLANPVLGGLA